MKKFLAFALVALMAGSAMAALDWAGDSYIYDVANDTWYKGSGNESWATGGVFNGANFGVVSTLFLGGQLQSYDTAGTTATMFFEVFQGGDSQGTYNIDLGWISTGTNDKWENIVGVDVAAGLAPSTEYTVAIWFNVVDGGSTTVWDSNGGVNYTATFTTADAPIPEPATMSLLGLGALAMVIRRKLRK